MDAATEMSYDTNEIARDYRDFASCSLLTIMAEHSTLQYFGNLTGARVADFGCGNGAFLKKCLAAGASFGLGFDRNEPMLTVDGEKAKKEELRLVVQDCFEKIEPNYGQFDFASAHFVLQVCDKETAMATFFKNAFETLKPGGKFFICQADQDVNTQKDQEIIANLCGYLHLMRKDVQLGQDGKSPIVEELIYHPAPTSISESGRPFTREILFRGSGIAWSSEKLMQILTKVGFVNVALSKPKLPDDVAAFEKKQLESLENPYPFIGAEKPKH